MSFFFQAEDGIRDLTVTGVQTCALPISTAAHITRTSQSRTASWTASCISSPVITVTNFAPAGGGRRRGGGGKRVGVCGRPVLKKKKKAASLFIRPVPSTSSFQKKKS